MAAILHAAYSSDAAASATDAAPLTAEAALPSVVPPNDEDSDTARPAPDTAGLPTDPHPPDAAASDTPTAPLAVEAEAPSAGLDDLDSDALSPAMGTDAAPGAAHAAAADARGPSEASSDGPSSDSSSLLLTLLRRLQLKP